MNAAIIRFPVMRLLDGAIRPGDNLLSFDDFKYVHMTSTAYQVVGELKGLPIHWEGFLGKIGREPEWVSLTNGYRCSECNKVFFAADADGLKHECMEWSKPE